MFTMSPPHEISIRRHALYTSVELHVDGRKVAETSMAKDVSRDGPEIERFVRGYFHIGQPKQEVAA